jgi:RNA-directed DNA polymerase
LLLNVALHGLEEAAGVRYRSGTNAGWAETGAPVTVRYADLCRARHKSAYAESRVMPTGLLEYLPGGQVVVLGAA